MAEKGSAASLQNASFCALSLTAQREAGLLSASRGADLALSQNPPRTRAQLCTLAVGSSLLLLFFFFWVLNEKPEIRQR